MDDIRDDHWMDVAKEGDYKKKIHALRWKVYDKEKENLIKREFLVYIQRGEHCLNFCEG